MTTQERVMFPNTPEGRAKACEQEKAGRGNWEEYVEWWENQTPDTITEADIVNIMIHCIEQNPFVYNFRTIRDVHRKMGRNIDILPYAGTVEVFEVKEPHYVRPERANLPA